MMLNHDYACARFASITHSGISKICRQTRESTSCLQSHGIILHLRMRGAGCAVTFAPYSALSAISVLMASFPSVVKVAALVRHEMFWTAIGHPVQTRSSSGPSTNSAADCRITCRQRWWGGGAVRVPDTRVHFFTLYCAHTHAACSCCLQVLPRHCSCLCTSHTLLSITNTTININNTVYIHPCVSHSA